MIVAGQNSHMNGWLRQNWQNWRRQAKEEVEQGRGVRRYAPHLAEAECQPVYEAVRQHPGINLTALSDLLGMSWSATENRLAACDHYGLLIYEDDGGGLHPYE